MTAEQQGTHSGKNSFGAGIFVGGGLALAVAAGVFLGKSPQPPASAPPAPAGALAPAPAAPSMPPLAAEPPPPASPREAADQLFNEAMMASEQGDQAAVANLAPKAIAFYRALGPLDGDGTYHLASLQLANKDFAAARSTADGLLAKEPGHLLALFVAAQAAAGANDHPAAATYWQKLDAAYDAEAGRQLREYVDHQRMLPSVRARARQALGK